MSGKIKVRADSANEFREKQKHAEALGLSVENVWFGGAWEDSTGEAVFMEGGGNEVEKVGHKYFHVPLSTPNGTRTAKIQPTESRTRERGFVKVTFS